MAKIKKSLDDIRRKDPAKFYVLDGTSASTNYKKWKQCRQDKTDVGQTV